MDPPICPNCGEAIDPATCHCGEEIKTGIPHDNHYPVPAGCVCLTMGFLFPPNTKKEKEND